MRLQSFRPGRFLDGPRWFLDFEHLFERVLRTIRACQRAIGASGAWLDGSSGPSWSATQTFARFSTGAEHLGRGKTPSHQRTRTDRAPSAHRRTRAHGRAERHLSTVGPPAAARRLVQPTATPLGSATGAPPEPRTGPPDRLLRRPQTLSKPWTQACGSGGARMAHRAARSASSPPWDNTIDSDPRGIR